MPSQNDRLVQSIADWKALLREQGLVDPTSGRPSPVRLDGELMSPTDGTPGLVALCLPLHGPDEPKGFATIDAYATCVWGYHTRQRGQGPLHCRAVLDGEIGLRRDGSLYVAEATLTLHPRTMGVYSQWRARQSAAARLAPRTVRAPRGDVIEEVTRHLRANSGKRIIWAGRDDTHAYRDVVMGDAGLANLLEAKGCRLSGQHAGSDLCGLLASVDPRTDALVIISRGGGSRGELAEFDDSRVLKAVRESRVKVLCAMGHRYDSPLLEQVADWSVGVPADISAVLRPYCHGRSTPAEYRAAAKAETDRQQSLVAAARSQAESAMHRAQTLERDASSLRAELHRLHSLHEQERTRVGHQRVLEAQAAAAERLRKTYRLLAVIVLLVGALIVALGHPAVHPLTGSAYAVAGVAAASAAWWLLAAARRMGARPWVRGKPAPDLIAAFATARTIHRFNQVAAIVEGRYPRFRRTHRP